MPGQSLLTEERTTNRKLGFATAIGAQLLWGGFPLYIKLFKNIIEPVDFVAHRAIWSFAVLAAWLCFVSLKRKGTKSQFFKKLLADKKVLPVAVFATSMIAINWIVFVWAVSMDHAIDASLGYYICPQIVVLLGVIFLRERLTATQWIAVGLATIGVLIMTRSGEGKVWIGLLVAIAFGLYALVKKKTQLSAAEGLCVETGLMLVPAILFLVARFVYFEATIFPSSGLLTVALLGSGLATVAPLLLYAISVKHISLSTMGLLQFIGPTMQFLIGAFVFSEPVDWIRLSGFAFVWVGVSTYLIGLHLRTRQTGRLQQ